MSFDPTLHLSRQLQFLQRSTDSYDAGYHDEALRIAVVIRVLCHQTDRSTSLLKHLNATTISLRSTNIGIPPGLPKPISLRAMLVTSIEEAGMSIQPVLGNGIRTTYIPFSKWWSEIIFIENEIEITRRSLVLAAANQDGGAHVDHKLDSAYKFLTEDGAFLTAYISDKSGSKSVHKSQETHLALLRQLGFELLQSPELLGLTNAQKTSPAPR